MDEKKNDPITEKDDWDELFGVSYYSDDPEETEESEETAEEERNAEEESESGEATEEEESAEEEDTTESEEETESEDTEEQEENTESEEVGAEDPKPADEVASILEAIRMIDPSIESFNDLEDVGLFALLIDAGKTPEEALRESSPKLQARLVNAQKAASKNHLRSTVTSERADTVDMDAIKTVRKMYPGLSEKEAIKLYRRVNAQK